MDSRLPLRAVDDRGPSGCQNNRNRCIVAIVPKDLGLRLILVLTSATRFGSVGATTIRLGYVYGEVAWLRVLCSVREYPCRNSTSGAAVNWTQWRAGASRSALTVALAAAGVALDGGPAKSVPAPVYDWSGFYLGAHTGYGDIDSDGFFATSVDLSFGGGAFIAGGQVGWNLQHGGWVFGVEADISALDWRDVNVREEHYIADAHYLTTLRGRVGWAENNVLFYLTGGLAYLDAEVTTSSGGRDADQHGNTDGKDVSALGGAVGVGMEWGLTRNLSIRTEGLYLFFDQRESLANVMEGCRPGLEACLNAKENFFSIDDGFLFRLGANWRFAGGSPGYGPSGALTPYSTLRRGPYDWSGFYLGPQVGYGGANAGGFFANDRTIPDTGQPAFVDLKNLHNRGQLGGGQAGFNWQAGSIVFGVEGDLAAVDWDDLFKDRQVPESPPEVAVALDLNFLATIRGRLGWSVHNWLLYATGGVAFLDGEFENVSASSAKDISATGGVVGGGLEWGITPNLSVKGEGLYLAFDKSVDLGDVKGSVAGDRLDIGDGFVARLGANWRFGSQTVGGPTWDDKQFSEPILASSTGYDWRGFYLGAQFGTGGLVTDGMYNAFDIPSETIDLRAVNDLGVLGGGQIGYNWQSGSIVFGLEGDVAAIDWDGRQAEFAHPGQAVEFNSNVIATARGRIGWAPDKLLFFVTAGFAFLDAELDNTSNDAGRSRNLDTVGGVAGLGMEWGVTSSFSLKMEGDFLFFDDDTRIANLGSEGDAGDFFRIDDGFVARVGANWRFNSRL